MTQVKTIKQLTQMIYDGVHDFFILLNGGLRSGKYMDYSIYSEKFYITNEIDGTDQELTEAQFMDEQYTNIGKAMLAGALYAYE